MGYRERMKKKLGKALRSERKRLGLNLIQASEATGVDFGFIRRIEIGEVMPGLEILQRLADGYETTLVTILLAAGFK